MVDINKLFGIDRQLERQIDEIKRQDRLTGRLNEQIDEIKRQNRLSGELNEQIDKIKNQERLFGSISQTRLSLFEEHQKSISQITKDYFQNVVKTSTFIDHLSLAQQGISKSFFENVKVFQDDSLKNVSRLIKEVTLPLSTSSLIGKSIKENLGQLHHSLSNPYHSLKSDLFHNLEIQSRAAALSSVEAFSKTVSQNTSLLDNQIFLNQISKSLITFDRFTNNTLARLSVESDRTFASALKGSLILANEQILQSTSTVQSYLENSHIPEFNTTNLFFDRDFPRVNRYRVQKQELLRRDDIEEDEEYESLVIKSPSAVAFEQITHCMTLIGLCNEASETTQGNAVFTITSSLWLSAWKLVDVVPTNKDSFSIIVDCLYLMLYEGAGKDKLRFIEQGYISASEAELIWKIKHLRNKWLRHDIEHGKDNDIKKSRQHRKEALEWFGMEKVPYSKDEFVFLYNNLIFKVEEFLKLLLERVSKFSL